VSANPLTAGESGDELEAILARGRERYEIYCTPCHGANGKGRGMLWERAQIAAGDLSQERLVAAPDGELFDTVTNGLGLMQGYRYPIPAADRWAILAYVREIQAGRRR
jgi:mono/diheme cytochrome c family protein